MVCKSSFDVKNWLLPFLLNQFLLLWSLALCQLYSFSMQLYLILLYLNTLRENFSLFAFSFLKGMSTFTWNPKSIQTALKITSKNALFLKKKQLPQRLSCISQNMHFKEIQLHWLKLIIIATSKRTKCVTKCKHQHLNFIVLVATLLQLIWMDVW